MSLVGGKRRSPRGDDNNYCSGWDPNTKLLYIVRDDYLINATIDCFSIDDNTQIIEGITKYKWLN